MHGRTFGSEGLLVLTSLATPLHVTSTQSPASFVRAPPPPHLLHYIAAVDIEACNYL